jgi:hypothetical protein
LNTPRRNKKVISWVTAILEMLFFAGIRAVGCNFGEKKKSGSVLIKLIYG